jgi:hypothetical protein
MHRLQASATAQFSFLHKWPGQLARQIPFRELQSKTPFSQALSERLIFGRQNLIVIFGIGKRGPSSRYWNRRRPSRCWYNGVGKVKNKVVIRPVDGTVGQISGSTM